METPYILESQSKRDLGRVGGIFMSYWRTRVWLGPGIDATLAFSPPRGSSGCCHGDCQLSRPDGYFTEHANAFQWAHNEAQDVLQVKSSTILRLNSYFFLSAALRILLELGAWRLTLYTLLILHREKSEPLKVKSLTRSPKTSYLSSPNSEGRGLDAGLQDP